MNTQIIEREAPAWVWEIIDSRLSKSRDAEVKKAYSVLMASLNSAQKEWDLHCWRFGLTPEQFGTTFMFRRKEYTITGIRPNAPRYLIRARNADGKTYRFPREVIK